MDIKVKILCLCLLAVQVFGYPQTVTDETSFVVSTTRPPHLPNIQGDEPYGKEHGSTATSALPKIYEMRVDSNVTNRFAHTLVTSKVKNYGKTAQEAVFSIVLPKKAFISKFVMSIGGKDYDAYVKEKEQAQQIYNQAISSGQGAGLVSQNARESNRFTVSVNVEPESKVTFFLTYEQLLEREDNQYELVINIHPKQPVKDLSVYVNINESQPLKFVRAPPIRSGNDISEVKGDLDPRAYINHVDKNSAMVKFSPNLERQKELAKTLGTNVDEGLSGQFVVQYDVERSSNGGEVLLNDGYFVHFFAPIDVKPLPKYVLFVLDTSGSMWGRKMEQLKEAMKVILGELKGQDKFHLVDFNNVAKVLDLYNLAGSVQYPTTEPSFYYGGSFEGSTENIRDKKFAPSYSVNADNIKQANTIVEKMEANGGTNIADALKTALYLVEVDRASNSGEYAPQPMIIFLTDGEATVGVTDSRKIISQVSEQNGYRVPIYSLSFGTGADKDLLQKLSLRNEGFSRHIYEAADASLQLQDFYKHISSPLISNVTFKYIKDANELTKTSFPILFEGSELVVVGKLDKEFTHLPEIIGHGVHGRITLVPEVKKPVTRLERLWAYLTIQQLLDDIERTDNKTAYEKKALDLALKYSFVTPVSSLVVVKPNATNSAVEPVAADKASGVPVKSSVRSSGYNLYAAPANVQPLSNRFLVRTRSRPVPMSSFMRFGGGSYYSSSYSSGRAMYPMSIPDRDDVVDRIFMPHSLTSTTLRPNLSELQQLKRNLPWIKQFIVDDRILKIDNVEYKLGLNETSVNGVACPSTPKNESGICKLLHECSQIHSSLTNVDLYRRYRCDMDGLAAVCCPKN